MHPGELVVSTHPEQVPVLRYYLGGGLPLGDHARAGPRLADLRLARRRVAACEASNMQARRSTRLIADSAGRAAEFVVVAPVFRDYHAWNAKWTRLVWQKSLGLVRRSCSATRVSASCDRVATNEIAVRHNYFKLAAGVRLSPSRLDLAAAGPAARGRSHGA